MYRKKSTRCAHIRRIQSELINFYFPFPKKKPWRTNQNISLSGFAPQIRSAFRLFRKRMFLFFSFVWKNGHYYSVIYLYTFVLPHPFVLGIVSHGPCSTKSTQYKPKEFSEKGGALTYSHLTSKEHEKVPHILNNAQHLLLFHFFYFSRALCRAETQGMKKVAHFLALCKNCIKREKGLFCRSPHAMKKED